MILSYARVQCEAFAGQKVRDVIITIPSYFNHVERKGIVVSAEIAELNLLQVRFFLYNLILCFIYF